MDKAPKRYELKHIDGQPVFRIGLFDSQEFIDFGVMGKFSLYDGDDTDLIKNVSSDLKWRIKIKESKPAKDEYFLVLYESYDRESAEKRLDDARKLDKSATLRVLGGDICLQDRKVNNNAKYIISVGRFGSEMGARRAYKKFQPDFIPYVEKECLKPAGGHFEVFDAEYDKSAEVKDVVRIVPKTVDTKIKIFGVRSFDDLLQKDHFADVIFNGTIEFRFDPSGHIMAISEVPLESYLKRVIYSEIGVDLPLEFSKSLAIVCRSEAMARIFHKELGNPYDYTNTGHTLRYFGEEFVDENIDKAVDVTAGQVMYSRDYIRDAPFHLICGGHTEDAAGDDGEILYRGKYDLHGKPEGFGDLTDEQMVRKWIHSRPDTWCNLKGRKVPASLERVKKYFRWEVDYSRQELEDIIRKKIGEDIGILFEIIPHLRGRSGRLKEIELIGSLKNYRIRGQLNIREALAYQYLPSSCFLVERELDDTGTPISFTFVGAGHGHGIGMCKTGAAVMAMSDFTCEEILKHYFEDCEIRSIYDVNLD